ncbi:hypothetical protein TL16_g08831 [Triparma laevis f. inornata]|uniref:Uncharacterized protein n=1 Tax=Triparma laevis f. inornata TaxID=1714386 RepID=A0A9W7B426_9STRA|nr:hypothetical protein TL16_g08831 [Triparma laevis f. inornata]
MAFINFEQKPLNLTFSMSSGNPAQWEASLASIISRTNANLSSMNNKYGSAANTGPNSNPSQSFAPLHSPSRFQAPARQFVATPRAFESDQNVKPTEDGGDLEAKIMGNVRRLVQDKFVIVERSVDSLRQQITSLAADTTRVSGEVSAMGRSVNAQESMVESLRHDMNSRRGMLAKMESWVADEEAWRSSMDSKVAMIANDVKQLDGVVGKQQESISARASMAEMKVALDGAHLTATSSVAAAMAPIQTHLERELEAVRRHVAALRIGRAQQDIAGMEPEEVEKALTAEQPSELLVKSVVSSAMSGVEEKLEDKIKAHLMNSIKVEANASQQVLSKLIPGEVERVFRESGFGTDVAEVHTKLEEKERAAAALVEQEMRKFMEKVEGSSESVEDVKRQFKELEKNQQITTRSIERQIEDGRSTGNQRAEDLRDRMRELEKNVRQTEQRLTDSTSKAKEDLVGSVQQSQSEWTTEFNGISKRLSVNESTIANYAANDDRTMTALKNYGNRMENIEGMSKDLMKRVVDSGDLDHRLTSIEGSFQATTERVSGVEMRMSEFKKTSSVEAEKELSKVQGGFDKIKEDFAGFKQSYESKKNDTSVTLGTVSGAVEGLKKDVELMTGRIGDTQTGLDNLESQVDQLAARPVTTKEGKEQAPPPPAVTKEQYKALQKKSSELENKIQMLQAALAAVEDGHVSTQKEMAKVTNLANQAKEQTGELNKKVSQHADEVGSLKAKTEVLEGSTTQEISKMAARQEEVKKKAKDVAKKAGVGGRRRKWWCDSDSDGIELSSDDDSDEEDVAPSHKKTNTGGKKKASESPKAKAVDKVDKTEKASNNDAKRKGASPKNSSAKDKKKESAPKTPVKTPTKVDTSITSIDTDDSFLKDTPTPKKGDKKEEADTPTPKKGDKKEEADMTTPVRGSPKKAYTPKRTPSVDEMHAAPTTLSSDDESQHGDEESDTEPETDL